MVLVGPVVFSVADGPVRRLTTFSLSVAIADRSYAFTRILSMELPVDVWATF
jgi:hypothetical protein